MLPNTVARIESRLQGHAFGEEKPQRVKRASQRLDVEMFEGRHPQGLEVLLRTRVNLTRIHKNNVNLGFARKGL